MTVSNREQLAQFPGPPVRLRWHPEVMHEIDHDRVCERVEELLWFVRTLGELERWPPESGTGEFAADLRLEARFEIGPCVFETTVSLRGDSRRARVFLWARDGRAADGRATVWVLHGVSASLTIESIVKRRVVRRLAWVKGHLQDQAWSTP